jgi:phosphoglycerol transferase MdoB-like AlkP superfamily enzyme
VLSGYPALPKNSIINYPQKLPNLYGLGKTLARAGYSNWFYYGGETEFANMKGYILDQQFSHLISKDDFAKKDQNSKWGAHDDVVMKKILNDMKGMQQPFFTTFLTLTSHEPFETPVPTVFHGKSFSTRLMNTIHYTDSCLFRMIEEMKKEQWWNNTLVVIVADHGHYEPSTGERADDYRVPLLWLGGALTKKDTIITGTVNQLDIARTILNQMGLDASPFIFSRDLFGVGRNNWAFFTYNDGIGLITDSSRMIYDNAGQRVVYEQGKVGAEQSEVAKALMWKVYNDFLKR